MIRRKILCTAALVSSLCLPAAAAEVQKSQPSTPHPAYRTNVIPDKVIPDKLAPPPGGSAATMIPLQESRLLSDQLQRPAGIVSGPAYGINVIPSTALQKMALQPDLKEGRSVSPSSALPTPEILGALTAAGGPGIEGMPNTQSGR